MTAKISCTLVKL